MRLERYLWILNPDGKPGITVSPSGDWVKVADVQAWLEAKKVLATAFEEPIRLLILDELLADLAREQP